MIDVEKLAREAGFGSYSYEARSIFERFAALVLEKAAQKCESMSRVPNSRNGLLHYGDARSFACAQAIRSMKPEAKQ